MKVYGGRTDAGKERLNTCKNIQGEIKEEIETMKLSSASNKGNIWQPKLERVNLSAQFFVFHDKMTCQS
jgi:hypothetical protein